MASPHRREHGTPVSAATARNQLPAALATQVVVEAVPELLEAELNGIQIGRFEDGKLVERWGSSDELALMQQIGAV